MRNIAMQALVLGFVLMIFGFAGYNAAVNLKSSGIASGFGFLTEKAGYDISFSLIDYSPKYATHAYAWFVGVLNTVFFAIITIISTTILAFLLAIMRLSPNKLLSALSRTIIEYVRNVPVLVHIFIWYAAFLTLPSTRQAFNIFDVMYLSNRGLIMPSFTWQYDSVATVIFLCFLALALWGVSRHKKGSGLLVRLGYAIIAIVLTFGISSLIFSPAFKVTIPILSGFGFKGGMILPPELSVMWVAVTIYFSSHCAELIRGAIIAVNKGQAEAALALGAKRSLVMMEVVIPQALRAIVPPMTSNYINILKAAALGTSIGYLDVMGTTGGSTLNITGQSVECILIVMVTYMILNLSLSALMGRVNKAVQIKER